MPVIVVGGVVVALADVFIIIAAAAMLYVAYATKGAFIRPFVDLVASVPVIGGQLAGIISDGWDGMIAGLQRSLDDAVGSLNAMLDLLHGAFQVVLQAATGTAEWLGYWTGQAIEGLGDLGKGLLSQLGHLLDVALAASRAAADALDKLGHLAAKVQALVQGGIDDLIQAALHDFRAVVGELIVAALVPIHAAIHSVRLLVHQFHSVEVAARRAADTQLGEAIDGTRAALNTRIHGVEGDVADLKLEGQSIEGELADILGTIGVVAAGTTLVGLITQVATEVTTMRRECVDPTCGFLGPQLDILNALGSTATLAAVAAMVEAAATQPRQAASSAVGTVDGQLGTVFGLFEGIAGVRVQ